MIQTIHHELSALEIAQAGTKGIIPCKKSGTEGGFAFTATDEDPQIFLPNFPLEPLGGCLSLEITVPVEVMVQVFYQTLDSSEFSETHSLSVSLRSGRHRVEWISDQPWNGCFRIDPGNLPGTYVIHHFKVTQHLRQFSLMPKCILGGSLHSNQLRELNLDEHGLHMKATGRDPYFLLPKIDLEPQPTVIKLEATLQRQAMVQLYFQTDEISEFTEENSVTVSSASGRNTFQWFLTHSFNGFFRLDPGNMPWEYTIHQIEALQAVYLKELQIGQILADRTQSRQINEIEATKEGVVFNVTGNDPCIILPVIYFLNKVVQIELDITLPCEALVQWYFQNHDVDNFNEQLSLKKSRPSGRHTIHWTLPEGIQGPLRLDPGNQTGRYCIHKILFQQ